MAKRVYVPGSHSSCLWILALLLTSISIWTSYLTFWCLSFHIR
jgi:hypothetical protein